MALVPQAESPTGDEIVDDGLLAAVGLYCGLTFSQLRSETMKNICAIVIAMMLVAVPLSLWPQNAPDGAQIYKDRCASCHGAKGEGLAAVIDSPG